MKFSGIIGNAELKGHLAEMVREGRTGHALLFQEEPGYGAMAYALALSQYLCCPDRGEDDSCGVCESCNKIQKLIHPDVHFAFPVNTSQTVAASAKQPVSDMFLPQWRGLVTSNPYFTEQDLYDAIGIENKSGGISVNEAKNIIDALSLRPFQADYKIMIVYLPERMNVVASNKLLKLLEEPPAGTVFMLITQSLEKLLPTIVSRCQIIPVPPMLPAELTSALSAKFGFDEETAKIYARLSGGSYGLAMELVREESEVSSDRQILYNMLERGISHDLDGMFPISETLCAMGKEKQRNFCTYGEILARKLLMLNLKMDGIAYVTPTEKEYLESLSKRIRPDFYRKMLSLFDGALSDLDNNVNVKLLFTNLCDQFYLYL
jgi:DNA polymerase-3 subunit delta'